MSAAARSASLVLPTPPVPVRVSSRADLVAAGAEAAGRAGHGGQEHGQLVIADLR
jgi:hypothetical protein